MKNNYSQFRAMRAIAFASFRSIIRNPSAVIFSLAFPLVFIVVFGFINGNKIKMEVGVDSNQDTTASIYQALLNVSSIDINTNFSEKELLDRLNRGRIDAILKIHKTPENGNQKVEIIISEASRERGMIVKSIVSNLVDKINLNWYKRPKLFSADLSSDHDIAELKETVVEGRNYKMIDFILPGQLGFSILSAAVFGTAFVFYSLRQTLVLKRFFATPIRRPYIILGEAISRLVFQLMGSSVIIILGHYVFGFTLINGLWTAIEMLLLSALGLIVFMGFGFVVSGIAKSENVIPPIANIVTLPQFLLCGTFFPIDAFPQWLQFVSKILPLTYLNNALRMVAFEGAGITDISTHLLILCVWGIVIYAAAIRFFRWE